MALTEKSRSALYRGLCHVIDEEAVEEMLSFFPARDVDEAVTREFLRAELAGMELRLAESLRAELRSELRSEVGALRAEMGELRAELRSELQSEIGGLRAELQSEIGGLRAELQSEIGGLRAELHSEIGGLRAELREELRRTVWINIGTLVAFAAVIITAVRL